MLPMLVLLPLALPAGAATILSYTGSLQQYTVPQTGDYDIVAYGAQGGTGTDDVGGDGAEIGAEFLLTEGEVLEELPQKEPRGDASGVADGDSFARVRQALKHSRKKR